METLFWTVLILGFVLIFFILAIGRIADHFIEKKRKYWANHPDPAKRLRQFYPYDYDDDD
jgi:hypothetical protein